MPEINIQSVDDPRISVFRDLPKSDRCDLAGRFIVEGQHLVERLLASSFRTESVLTCHARAERLRSLVPAGVPVFVADNQLLSEIVGFRFHRGVLACGLRRPVRALSELVPPAPAPVTLLLLSEVLDPENLGASLRAAAAFGVDTVVVGPQCPDPFMRRVIRVSMGAVWKLSLAVSDDLVRDVDWLQQHAEVEVLATVLDPQAEPLARADRSRRTAILLGGEGDGLPSELIRRCHRRVTIPMQMATDSLNVSMAAGIFLYHFTQAERVVRSAQ